MNYADIKRIDVANGIGIRVSIFVSGCTHHCKGCFNEDTWDFHYGKPYTVEETNTIIEYLKPNYISGLSLLGGEPFEPANQVGLLPLLKKVKEVYPQKSIWCYTGYTFETDLLSTMAPKFKNTYPMLSLIDVLIDGEFVEELKDLSIRFRGSSNQRIIDVPASLKAGQTILWKDEL